MMKTKNMQPKEVLKTSKCLKKFAKERESERERARKEFKTVIKNEVVAVVVW